MSVVLAPVRVPLRIAQALDDLADIAERARRDPDPVEEVRVRIDALLVEIDALNGVAREIRDGGRELTEVARGVLVMGTALHETAMALDTTGRTIVVGGQDLTAVATQLHVDTRELTEVAKAVVAMGAALHDTSLALDATGRTIVVGGQDLTAVATQLDGDTRELIDGGRDLTSVSKDLERHARVFRAALPRLLEGLDTVEELETAVETVADTVEPLQGAAERVGRVTERFSRKSA